MTDNNTSVGATLRNGRLAKQLTQQELADATGISHRSIQRIEKDEVVPRAYTIRVLSEHLGITVLQKMPRELEARLSNVNPAAEPVGMMFNAETQNKPLKRVLSVSIAVLLLLGGIAFIFQSARFPETAFESVLFWMGMIAVYTVVLIFIWREKKVS